MNIFHNSLVINDDGTDDRDASVVAGDNNNNNNINKNDNDNNNNSNRNNSIDNGVLKLPKNGNKKLKKKITIFTH
jgi:hypothetical protein